MYSQSYPFNVPLTKSINFTASNLKQSFPTSLPHQITKSQMQPIKYGQLIKSRARTHGRALQIPPESKIQYIPFEKKHITYDSIQKIRKRPVQKTITEFVEKSWIKKVKCQKSIKDWFAVEFQTQFVPRQTVQTIIQYQPICKNSYRLQYLPHQFKIIHLPYNQYEITNQSKRIQKITNNLQNSTYTNSQQFKKPLTSLKKNHAYRTSRQNMLFNSSKRSSTDYSNEKYRSLSGSAYIFYDK